MQHAIRQQAAAIRTKNWQPQPQQQQGYKSRLLGRVNGINDGTWRKFLYIFSYIFRIRKKKTFTCIQRNVWICMYMEILLHTHKQVRDYILCLALPRASYFLLAALKDSPLSCSWKVVKMQSVKCIQNHIKLNAFNTAHTCK